METNKCLYTVHRSSLAQVLHPESYRRLYNMYRVHVDICAARAPPELGLQQTNITCTPTKHSLISTFGRLGGERKRRRGAAAVQ